MSLGGIALAIGVLVDAAIVMVENGYRRTVEAGAPSTQTAASQLSDAARQVGRPVFFSLAVILVSFVPVFLLESQEGRLFRPLAMTKTFGVTAATLFAITLVPALLVVMLGRRHGQPAPLNRLTGFLNASYEPILRLALRRRWLFLAANAAVIPLACLLLPRLGHEFMPQLYEGSILYMPTAAPGLSITDATRLLQVQDRVLRNFPEVERVFGTAGRATTATDNSPLSMITTIVTLKPRSAWREGVTFESLQQEMDAALQVPGIPNVWTQPIRSRIDMLSTGIRTPIGIKVLGAELDRIQTIGRQIETVLQTVNGTRSVFAERTAEGYFVDIQIDRPEIARYGLTVEAVQSIVQSAIGGAQVGVVLDGRERYPINVRYHYDFRSDPKAIEGVLVKTTGGGQIPLGRLATVALSTGPAMIRTENGVPVGYVYVDPAVSDIRGYVARAQQALAERVRLPPGYRLEWSGQYEAQVRAAARLRVIIPVAVLAIFALLYLTFHSLSEASIIMLSVLYAMTGGVLFQWLLGYNFSVAVWVGYIALYGLAVQTGVIMVVYLREALERRRSARGSITEEDVFEATVEGAVQRLRPKLMTVLATTLGLLPILWSTGIGSDVLKPIAGPIVGGMVTSAIHVLIVTPVIFFIIQRQELRQNRAIRPIACGEEGEGAEAQRGR
jgi:Cu(I)/Ag(I) efflux system membrane protein CusA/SilA